MQSAVAVHAIRGETVQAVPTSNGNKMATIGIIKTAPVTDGTGAQGKRRGAMVLMGSRAQATMLFNRLKTQVKVN